MTAVVVDTGVFGASLSRRRQSIARARRVPLDTSRDATRTTRLIWPNVVETTTSVDLMGRYSNPEIASTLDRIVAGQGRDRVSHRPVPSLRQKQTRLTDSQRSELVERYLAGESARVLAIEFGVHRTTVARVLQAAGVDVRYRVVDADVNAARELYEPGFSLARVGDELGVWRGPC